MGPGDVFTYQPDSYYVYELIDDEGVVFYIGQSNCPPARLHAHYTGGHPLVMAKLRSLKQPRCKVIAGPLNKRDALSVERQQIMRPGRVLLNGEHQAPHLRRHPAFEVFLRTE